MFLLWCINIVFSNQSFVALIHNVVSIKAVMWLLFHIIFWPTLDNFAVEVFTARCTLVQSAVLPSHVVCLSVCLSVCNVGEL